MSAPSLAEKLDTLPSGTLTAPERLIQAFELHELGVLMQVENFKRRTPGISPEELAKRMRSWLAREGEE